MSGSRTHFFFHRIEISCISKPCVSLFQGAIHANSGGILPRTHIRGSWLLPIVPFSVEEMQFQLVLSLQVWVFELFCLVWSYRSLPQSMHEFSRTISYPCYLEFPCLLEGLIIPGFLLISRYEANSVPIWGIWKMVTGKFFIWENSFSDGSFAFSELSVGKCRKGRIPSYVFHPM